MGAMRMVAHALENFMVWNTFLALLPLALAIVLFRPERVAARGRLWWIGVAAFVALLPNAPYVLTDVVHLIAAVRQTHSHEAVALFVLPAYAAFFFIGVESYALCLRKVRRAL